MSEPSENVGTRLMFENDRVRIWDFALAPGETLPRHVHRTDYLFVVTNGGRLRITNPADPTDYRDVEYNTDLVRFIPVTGDKIDNPHTNIGDDPYRNLVVELLQPAPGEKARFKGVFPIGATKVDAIPVKELGPAVAFYTQVLGFTLVKREATRAELRRDEATIGLETNGDDPEQASCYFSVSDVDALHAELSAKGIEPSGVEKQAHDRKGYRVFFAKEPYGVCFCFGQPAEGE
jgi:catechol 2,3-dioxygenase-like lactoylglutathione lyase family enzyme